MSSTDGIFEKIVSSVVKDAATSDFEFKSMASGLEQAELNVVSFTGIERISRPYVFTLQLQSESLDPDDFLPLLDQPATFAIHSGTGFVRQPRRYHGIVSSLTWRGIKNQRAYIEVELVPRLWRLSLRRNHRIFTDATIPQVVQEVLGEYDLKGDYLSVSSSRESAYPQRDYIVQYDESDLDFVSRLLESHGIAYCFKQLDEFEQLYLSDSGQVAEQVTDGFPDVPYRDAAGLVPQVDNVVSTSPDAREAVYEFGFAQYTVTSKVTLRDFDYNPVQTLPASPDEGMTQPYEHYGYPGGFRSSEHGDMLTNRRREQYAGAQRILRGKSGHGFFAAGRQFSLSGHSRPGFNTQYTLISVLHRGADPALAETAEPYSNEFECVPADVVYRPPLRTPKPVVRGPQTATCIGPKDEQLHMDELGRAMVRFHWDRRPVDEDQVSAVIHQGASDERKERVSAFIRVSHPYAGRGHGIQFHPLIGDEVIVDFEEGDPDRPLITGRVYNSENMPPLRPEGRIQNVLYTPYQHKLLFDDNDQSLTLTTGGSEILNMADEAGGYGNNIKLSTADSHSVQLAKGDSLNGIEARTEGGHRAVMDDKNKWIQLTTTGQHEIQLSDEIRPGIYISTKEKHYLWLSDAAKVCYLGSTNKNQVSIDDNGNVINLALEGGHLLQLNGDGNSVTILSKNKHLIQIDDHANNITIKDKSGDHTIQIQDDGAKIMIHAKTGDIHVNAVAGTLDLHGNEVKITADTKVTIKGMDIESAADMTHTVKGNSVMSNGSVTNVVKGGMVHLNP